MGCWKTIVVLLLMISSSYSYESSSFSNLRIDCGASTETPGTGNSYINFPWQTDKKFIRNGGNRLLYTNNIHFQMNTLRYFPTVHRSCYTLPFYRANEKYLFRAGFYYGNYDGLYNPPSFRLEIDGFLWAEVTTSMSEEMIYYELLYITKKSRVRVCLVRNVDNIGVPFISSLEAYSIYDAYNWMDNTTALSLHSRINYGADTSIERKMNYQGEVYYRIWKSKQMSNYLNVHATDMHYDSMIGENNPPYPVMEYAIQARNVTDSIYLSFDFSDETAVQAYFVLYFMDPIPRTTQNETCSVEIYVDNNKMAVNDVPDIIGSYSNQFHVVTLFSVPVNGSANVTISPAEGSTLAPLLNAMEVFSAIDVSEASGNLYLSSLLFIVSLHLLLLLVTY